MKYYMKVVLGAMMLVLSAQLLFGAMMLNVSNKELVIDYDETGPSFTFSLREKDGIESSTD